MKPKIILFALLAFAALAAAHRYLNSGSSSRGSLEPDATAEVEEREKFRVGFLPVT